MDWLWISHGKNEWLLLRFLEFAQALKHLESYSFEVEHDEA
jgi:hypothetical protein